jgi:hypothetical protein
MMAWNPSAEVQVARGASLALTGACGHEVDRIVILYTTVDGKMGYASYGKTAALCGSAKRLADAAYEAMRAQLVKGD